MNEDATLTEVRRLLEIWKPRLGVSERVTVEVFRRSDPQARCAMLPARVVPEAQGLWDFVLEWSGGVHADDVEHTVVHELVHLMLEPLRERYFKSISDDEPHPLYMAKTPSPENFQDLMGRGEVILIQSDEPSFERVIPLARVEDWETVIERIADAYERAWQSGVRDGAASVAAVLPTQ
jgi:hypothetical protein